MEQFQNIDENKNYICLRCGKLFQHRGLLNRHLKNKNPCIIKYLTYTREELINDYYKLFKKHEKQIANIINVAEIACLYACTYCGKKTRTQKGLKQHLLNYCQKNKLIEEQYRLVVKNIYETIKSYKEYLTSYKSFYKLEPCSEEKYNKLVENKDTINKLDPIIKLLKRKCGYTKKMCKSTIDE